MQSARPATPATPAIAAAAGVRPTPQPARTARRPFPGRRGLAATAALAAIAGLGVVAGPASPAGALVNVATSGTTMTVTLTGAEDLHVSCVGGVVTVNTKTGSPTVPCATFSKIAVNGDSAKQTIDGRELEAAVFAAKPYLVAQLGDGPDIVETTSRADSIDMGPGDDRVYAWRSTNQTLIDGGTGSDYIRIEGGEGVDDAIVVSSTNTNATITHEVGGVVRTHIAKNFESTDLSGKTGNDSLDASGITTGSSIKSVAVYGGEGNDTVRAAQFDTDLFAGPGTNQIFGGPDTDNIGSEGNGDVIKTGGGTADRVYDRNSGRSGRTIDNLGQSNWYFFEGTLGDTTTRVRPGPSGTTVVTNSLTRTGQQTLGTSFKNVGSRFLANSSGNARGLADVVALTNGRKVYPSGDQSDDDLLDVTIPLGSWTTIGTPQGTYFITPTNPAYAEIQASNFGAVSVHGPWTNKNNGFIHRSYRDLVFRFPTGGVISQLGTLLTSGATTRQTITTELMDTDEYRGLDVDRTFTRFLRRTVDPGGRTYWINSIGNGKALWRFRAQLFGSNEYFTKAGGTNAAYLDRVYFDVLGRQIDPSGKAYWGKKLDNGADRGSVALNFINSSEFRRFVVDDQFLRILDRKASAGEHATWDGRITGTTTGEQDLIAFLVASDEYYNRS
jgi:hypothetical protein